MAAAKAKAAKPKAAKPKAAKPGAAKPPAAKADAAKADAAGAARGRRYWLFKSEPETYGWDRFVRERRTGWTGVRNFQARNLLRDEIRPGDGVLFYHSSADPPAVVGLAKVSRSAWPDETAFDPASPYHDPDSTPDAPRWVQVEIEAVAPLREPLPRDRLKALPELREMELLRPGSRLSVQPVRATEWRTILRLGGGDETW